MKPSEFWPLTWGEFAIIRDGFIKRLVERNNKARTAAWLCAAWTRSKEMPDLKDVLVKDEPQEETTEKEMISMFKILTAQMGGQIVEA